MDLITHAIGESMDTLSIATLHHYGSWVRNNPDSGAPLEKIVLRLEAHPFLKAHPWNKARKPLPKVTHDDKED